MTNDQLSTALVALFVLAIAGGVAVFSVGAAFIVLGVLGIAWVVMFVREAPDPRNTP